MMDIEKEVLVQLYAKIVAETEDGKVVVTIRNVCHDNCCALRFYGK